MGTSDIVAADRYRTLLYDQIERTADIAKFPFAVKTIFEKESGTG